MDEVDVDLGNAVACFIELFDTSDQLLSVSLEPGKLLGRWR